MSYHPLSPTKGGEALLLDDASVPGKTVHTAPAGQSADLLHLSVVNLSTAERSLFFAVTGTDITPPATRDAMDRIDVQPSPTGVTRLTSNPIVIGPGYSLRISADTPPGEPNLVLYGYAERAGTSPAAAGVTLRAGIRLINTPDQDGDYPYWVDDLPLHGDERTPGFSRLLDLNANAMLIAYVNASADIGTLNVVDSTFEVTDLGTNEWGALYGATNPLSVSENPSILENYAHSVESPAFAGNVNPGSGMIIVPSAGLYHVSGWIYGVSTT